MKRWNVLWLGALAGLLWGCQDPNAKPKTDTATVDPNATHAVTPLPPENPYGPETGTPPPGGTETTIAPPPAAAGRTHVVARGDTLYSLARKYYNDGRQWKKIWEANKSRIPDQNRLQVGTKLIIP